MAIKLGLNCQLYRGEAGSTASILMENVKDVTLNLSTGVADITTRRSRGWRVNVATLKEGSVETSMLYDPNDEDFAFVLDAFLNNKPIALFVTDGEGNGLDADFVVTNAGQNQALEAGVEVPVTFQPTDAGRAPKYVTAGDESDSGSESASESQSESQSNP